MKVSGAISSASHVRPKVLEVPDNVKTSIAGLKMGKSKSNPTSLQQVCKIFGVVVIYLKQLKNDTVLLQIQVLSLKVNRV